MDTTMDYEHKVCLVFGGMEIDDQMDTKIECDSSCQLFFS